MTETCVPDFEAPLVIGATGMAAIRQNIRMIILTSCYSIPLDRAFAHDYRLVDSPAPRQTARLSAQLTDAIEKYEPRVKVVGIEWLRGELAEGILRPAVTFTLKEGVEL